MTARGRKRAEGAVVAPTVDLRLGRWQDVLGDVRPDTVIVDAPYSERTHRGAAQDATARTEINYAWWGKTEIDAFVSSWAPRTSCWIASVTDSNLMPLWLDAYEAAGMYAFAPVGIVFSGMGVRLAADGPASWTLYACVARQKRRMAGTKIWRSLPGAYVGTQGASGSGGEGGGGRGKPSWLVEALVADYSDPGMLVCDPCAGWGSTLVAARKLGRSAIGAEIDADAYAIAARRVVGDESRPRPEQPSLFGASHG